MDDTDALELTGFEGFVLALLGGGPLVVPDDSDAAEDDTGGSPAS
jgi:hypothetical protein